MPRGGTMRNGRPAELVMGSVQLGLSYGATNRTGKPPRDTALRLVRRAANAGVSVFDTARSYGDAEERLGAALAGRGASARSPNSTLNDLVPDASPAAVCAAVDQRHRESLAALRLNALSCVLLHRAEHMTPMAAQFGAACESISRRGRSTPSASRRKRRSKP